MLDNLNTRDDGSGDAGRERPRRASEHAQPLSDREVPLGGTATSETINRWLDGEAPEPAALNADAARQIFPRQVEVGFCFDVEDLVIAQTLGFPMVEVAVEWSDVEGTKVGLLEGVKSFTDLARIRGRSLSGRYN